VPEFIDKTGINKTDKSCCGAGEEGTDPDPTGNIENCYHCTNPVCGCNKDSDYKDDLVKKITDDILKE
jgi:hypothetical protein